MTTPFYAPPSAFKSGRVVLPDDEARHASKVLRHTPGDEIVVVDGVGGWHRVQLDHVRKTQVIGHVVSTDEGRGELPVDVTVGFGLIKNRGRFETFVEKAVELGVACIQPLYTERTEAESIRETRTRNLMIAAMKQSERSRLPALKSPSRLDDSVFASTNPSSLNLICHEGVETARSISSLFREAVSSRGVPEAVTLLVGPEGGFTREEVDAAGEAGFQTVSLGSRRLRAETAGILATGAVMLAIEDALAAS